MLCPKCNGKVLVTDTRGTPNNDIYRERKCVNCGYIFYTIEFEVESTDDFKKEWSKYHRHWKEVKKNQ